MITDKQLKSGLRKCKGHKYNTLRYIFAGKGYLKCPKCNGYLEVPEKGLEVDFDIDSGRSKYGFNYTKFIGII